MEKIINIPGLQHLAEKVFLNLEQEDLEVCAMINQSSKQILDNPIFWLKKFVSKGMSKKNETDWAKAIKSAKKSDKKKQILLYLKWHLKTQEEVDLPFYTNSIVQKKFRLQISEAAQKGSYRNCNNLGSINQKNQNFKKICTYFNSFGSKGRSYRNYQKLGPFDK